MPFLLQALTKTTDFQVCRGAAATIGDVARAVGQQVSPFAVNAVKLLLDNLHNQAVDRSVKPPTMAVFGDLALALGTHFEEFLPAVVSVLIEAGKVSIPHDDDDLVDYLNEHREAIFEALTGIIHGLSGSPERNQASRLEAMAPFWDAVLNYVVLIASDYQQAPHLVDAPLLEAACNCLGDVCSKVGPPAKAKVQSAHQIFDVLFKAVGEPAAWARAQCF